MNLKERDYLNELSSILWPYSLNNNNYLLIESLIKNFLFQQNSTTINNPSSQSCLKKSLKLNNIYELIQKYNLNCLNVTNDIPLIEIDGGVSTSACETPDTEHDDIYLSKTIITINRENEEGEDDDNDEEEEIIYLIVKNELKYKLF